MFWSTLPVGQAVLIITILPFFLLVQIAEFTEIKW